MTKKKEPNSMGRVVKYLVLIAIALAVVLVIRTQLFADIRKPLPGDKDLPSFKQTNHGIVYYDTFEASKN
jgi:hypothetical protein